MIKDRMKPTVFRDHYKLEWYDAEKKKVADEAIVFVELAMLTFNFPLLHTQMRYSR